MINPKTISEQMMFSTVRIESGSSIGTGFIYIFKVDGQTSIPVIITNKHVIETQVVSFYIHEAQGEENSVPSGKFQKIQYKTDWVDHPDGNIDLCATPLQPLIQKMKEVQGKTPFFKQFSEQLLWSDLKLEDLSAVEDVLMVGYPIGLWDDVNNLPLIRRGVTALHPSVDFKGKPWGVVDMSCFPGSSGSPILIANEGMYSTKTGTTVGTRAILLGVLFSGPTYDSKGEVDIEEIPTKKANFLNKVMVNLGYYIKAKEIEKLGEAVRKKYVS